MYVAIGGCGFSSMFVGVLILRLRVVGFDLV